MKLSVIFTFNFVPFSLTSLVTEKMRGKTKDFRVKKEILEREEMMGGNAEIKNCLGPNRKLLRNTYRRK